jgi:hypothetical protein
MEQKRTYSESTPEWVSAVYSIRKGGVIKQEKAKEIKIAFSFELQ